VERVKNLPWTAKEDADCMAVCHCLVLITLRMFMETARKNIVKSVQLELST